MSEPLTFHSLAIEAFRGFRDRQDIPLDASVVIAAGPNGTGQSSLFDAIQWLLLGRIERLASLKTRLNDEWIVNQYRRPGPSVVEAQLMIQGHKLRLRRSGTAASTLLEWEGEDGTLARGEDAERLLADAMSPSPTVSLESALLTAGLLQQDVMRSVLEAKANERFDVLNRLLGLDALEGFEAAVREWAKGAANAAGAARTEEASTRDARERAEARLAALDAEMAARPSTEALQRDLLDAVVSARPRVEVALPAILSADDIAGLTADLVSVRAALGRAARDFASLVAERSQATQVSETDLSVAMAAHAAAVQELEERDRRAKQARKAADEASSRSSQLARLAALAIPLLTDACPVCNLEIDPVAVAEALQQRADDNGDLVALERASTEAHSAFQEAQTLTTERQRALVEMQAQAGRLRELQERRVAVQSSLESVLAQAPTVALAETVADDPTEMGEAVLALERVERALNRVAAVAQFSNMSDEQKRLRAEIEASRTAQASRRARTEQLAQRHVEAKNLQDATTSARVAVGARRMDSLRPLIADIYSRLDPHPTFTDLDVEHDIYRAKGTMTTVVRDPVMNQKGDPVLLFSSSQANIAALSYFLALGWAAGHAGLPFVLLDDPLQSMDDVNVLGFADLSRFIRSERQLLISTHDRRFSALLARKLSLRSPDQVTMILNFLGWDRSGPQIEPVRVPPQIAASGARLAAA